jgi:hypothetical protein
MHGIVERIRRDAQNGSIRADDGREFDFESTELSNLDFDDLLLGMKVDFDAQEPMDSDGLEATEIRVEGEVKPVAADEVRAKDNKNPDVEAIASQTPAASVNNEVDEAAWETFPASDPPAR